MPKALSGTDAALALRPGHLDAHLSRGGILISLGRFDEALESFDRAIALRPDCVNAHIFRGEILKDLKRFDEALASYDRAIALQPDSADAHWSKSNLLLLMGDYLQGWRLHEWRWQSPYFNKQRRDFKQPAWLGESSPAGKTLLIHAEGDFGDVIQKCRYIPAAQALGADVIVEMPATLVRLMSSLKGISRVVTKGDPLPAFDLHCPTMSLPLAFRTTAENIPADLPYLHADADKVDVWRRQLGDRSKPRIGLAWSGMVRRELDPNPARKRSMPLRSLAPLLDLPVEFHSLQKQLLPDELSGLADWPQICQHHQALEDFSDTAALIAAMDLVISIDTSVAHLAAALGEPLRWVSRCAGQGDLDPAALCAGLSLDGRRDRHALVSRRKAVPANGSGRLVRRHLGSHRQFAIDAVFRLMGFCCKLDRARRPGVRGAGEGPGGAAAIKLGAVRNSQPRFLGPRLPATN